MNQLSKCDLCESTNLEFVGVVQDYNKGFKGNFNLYKCKNCKLMFLNPQPSIEEGMKYYTSDYYQRIDENTGIQKIIKNFTFSLQKFYAKNPNIFRMFLFLFSQYVRGIEIIPNGRYLDVGCGNGAFLYNLKKINSSGEYYGFEPGDFDTEDIKAHGLNVMRGTLEDAHYPDNYFDVITLNHVFEHVPNPSETMKELKRIIKPGGTLIIAVPNCNSLAYKLFGKYWYQLDAPRHLFTHSDKTMKEYASKFNFKIEKIRYTSLAGSFIPSIVHYFGKFIKKKNLWTLSAKRMQKGDVFLLTVYGFLWILLSPSITLLNLLKFGDSVEIHFKIEK